MRSLSSFLLFENVLDNLDQTNPFITQLSTQLFTPNVTIVQENCGTMLGKKINIDLTVNGLVRMDWNGTLNVDRTIPETYRISKTDIQTWLGKSIYSTYVRDIHYCTSMGGVCAACYAASLNTAAPEVGSIIQIPNQYVTQVDSYLTTTSSSYSHSIDAETYDKITVYLDNHPLDISEYSSDGSTLTLNTAPAYGQFLTINYIAVSNKPFLNYVSNTFSGDLLGIEPISYQDLFLPLSVIDRAIRGNNIEQLHDQMQALGNVDQIYLDYCSNVTNRIERAILTLILFTLYNDVQS